MSEEMNVIRAHHVYKTICSVLDERSWNYKTDEDNLTVLFGGIGEDLPIHFILMVDIERQLIRLLSPLTFEVNPDKMVEEAIACCVASNKMVDGGFDFDLEETLISFRMTASFRNSKIGADLLEYMIDCSLAMVDRYNDKFDAINKGELDIAEFVSDET